VSLKSRNRCGAHDSTQKAYKESLVVTTDNAQQQLGFTPADVEYFNTLRIPLEFILATGAHRGTHEEARDVYGIKGTGSFAGIVIPYFDLQTGRRTTCRLRRDSYPAGEGKYRSPFGDRSHLYLPLGDETKPGGPELTAFIRELLDDPKTEIALVEAEKSSWSMTVWQTVWTGRW
jgi:hypothetical protein